MKSLEHIIRDVHEGRGHDAVTQFAAAAHEEWRKGFDPEGSGKERIKKNSDGTEGNINVPFHKLHPDWQRENLEAGKAALVAVRKHPKNIEKAAEHVHNEWMKRNPKADWNASQHVSYSQLPEEEKEKDRVHVRKMHAILGKPIQENLCVEHVIRNVLESKRKIRETKLDDIESTKATRAGRFDTKMTESDLNYMGSGTGGEPKMHAEDGKKKKKVEESIGVGGSKDPVGNQFKSIRTATPHIKPPNGPGSHSQAPENAARQRTLAKERISMTMHGKVNEASAKTKAAETILDILSGLKKAPSTKGRELVPYVEKGAPAKVKGKELTVPKKGEPSTEVSTKTEPKTEVPTKTDTKVQQEVPTKTPVAVTEPKTEVPTKTDTKTKPVEPKTTPVTVAEPKPVTPVVEPKPVTVAEPKPVTPVVEPKKPVEPAETKKPADPFVPPFVPPFIGGGEPIKTNHDYDVLLRLGGKHHKGIAKRHKAHMTEESERKEIENVPRKGDRRSISYVGRKDDDPKNAREKTSRQAATRIKLNVVDESRKLSGIVLSTVKDKKQQMKTRTEDGLGQTSKDIQYPNGTVVRINPEISRTTMDIDGKLPNDYK